MKRNLLTIMLAFFVVFSVTAQKGQMTSVEKSPFSTNSVMNGVKAQWDIVFSFDALAPGAPGIETDGTNFYTTLWNGADFHRYDMDGANGATFTVAGVANVRDMAYDGMYFYGAAADMNLYQMDLENETLISTITATCTGVTGIRHIAYDPTLDGGNGGFWIGNWNELGAIAMDGSELIASTATLESCYGSAYDNWTDPANPKLWLFQQPTGAEAVFYEFDINTYAMTGVTFVADAANISGGACSYEAGGLFILAANIQADPNMVVAYELAVTADDLAPAAPTAFTAVADAAGAFTVQLDWTNPALDVAGSALADLTSIDVYLDGDATPIYTNATPTIGAADSYLATVATGGTHSFTVVGTNSAGVGIPAGANVFVGVDVEVSETNLPDVAGIDEVVTPFVTVMNNGVGAQTFDVTLSDGDAYSEVVSVTSLASGASEVLTFPDWSSATAAVYTFTATAADPGSDFDLANNEITQTLAVLGGCLHTLILTDSYGDGWNGATASVMVNGFTVLDHVTVDATENTYTFFADDGDDIQFDFWADGSWNSECSWVMLDGLGNELFSGSEVLTTENVVGLCTMGYSVTFNVTMTDSIASGYFVEGTDQLWVAGSMNAWTTPGDDAAYELIESATDDIYTVTVSLADADYEYKYFKIVGGVAEWTYGEWEGGTNRTFSVAGADVTLNDLFGNPTNSIAELISKGISVYPNPSNGVFTVNVENNFNLEVFDITGKVISANTISGSTTLELDNAGVYFLRFSNEKGSVTQRVIVQ